MPLLVAYVALVVFGVGLGAVALVLPLGGFLAFVISPMLALVAVVLRTNSLDPDHKVLPRTAATLLALALIAYFPAWATGRLEWDAPREDGPNEQLWLAAWWLMIVLLVITMTLIAYGLLRALGLGLIRWLVAPIIGVVSGFLLVVVLPLAVPVVLLVALILSFTAKATLTEPIEGAAAQRS